MLLWDEAHAVALWHLTLCHVFPGPTCLQIVNDKQVVSTASPLPVPAPSLMVTSPQAKVPPWLFGICDFPAEEGGFGLQVSTGGSLMSGTQTSVALNTMSQADHIEDVAELECGSSLKW